MIAIIFSVMNSDKFNAFQKFLLFNILFLISLSLLLQELEKVFMLLCLTLVLDRQVFELIFTLHEPDQLC